MNTSIRAILSLILLVGIAGCADVITYANDAHDEGLKLYKQGRYADAAGAFRNAVRQRPQKYESHYWLGKSYEQLNSQQLAIQAYESGLSVMPVSVAGKFDNEFKIELIDALARMIARSDNRDAELTRLEDKANATPTPENYWLLAKIYRYDNDADSAINAYNQARNLGPDNFEIAREYGLYLEQLGQADSAESTLRRAYQLNSNDQQVAAALRRLGVIPGLSLKDEDALAQPMLPRGPIPEPDLRRGPTPNYRETPVRPIDEPVVQPDAGQAPRD